MQTIVQFLYSDMNHSLKPAFISLTTIATSEEERKLNAMGIQFIELEAGPVCNKYILWDYTPGTNEVIWLCRYCIYWKILRQ